MTFGSVRNRMEEFHGEEVGDIPVGPLLMIGLIVIPLVIGLVAFGDQVMDWFGDRWGKVTDEDPDFTFGQ